MPGLKRLRQMRADHQRFQEHARVLMRSASAIQEVMLAEWVV